MADNSAGDLSRGVVGKLIRCGFAVATYDNGVRLILIRPDIVAIRITTPEAYAWLDANVVKSPMSLDLIPPIRFYRCAADWEMLAGVGWINRVRRFGFELLRQGAVITVPGDIAEQVTKWPGLDGMPRFEPTSLF